MHAATAELRAALPPLVTNLKELSASLRTSALNLEPAVSRLAPHLPELVDEGRHTAAGANQVIDAVKDFPLIRGKLNQPPTQPLLPTTPP